MPGAALMRMLAQVWGSPLPGLLSTHDRHLDGNIGDGAGLRAGAMSWPMNSGVGGSIPNGQVVMNHSSLIAVLLAIATSAAAAIPPPDGPFFDAMTWPASLKQASTKGVTLGELRVQFEETTLSQVRRSASIGTSGRCCREHLLALLHHFRLWRSGKNLDHLEWRDGWQRRW
jgi:hypothetical protein